MLVEQADEKDEGDRGRPAGDFGGSAEGTGDEELLTSSIGR